MDATTYRAIDRWLGVPLCALLTLHRRLRPARPVGTASRIALLKLAEQGATVVAVPAIRSLAERYGSDHVHLVVFEENRFIVDELGILPPKNVHAVRTTSVPALLVDLLRCRGRLRRRGVDATIDFESFARGTAAFAYLLGATRRVGLHDPAARYRGDLLTHRVACNPSRHAAETFLDLAHAVDVEPDSLPALPIRADSATELAPPPRTTPSATEQATIGRLVDGRLGVRPTELVLVNPNAGDLIPQRRWPIDRYETLICELLERRPEVGVLVTGSPDERPAAEALVAAVADARVACVAGATTMHELLVLYEASDVLITNDSGPAHYAGLTSIDVVALYGPESPLVFGPRSPTAQSLWKGLPCSPCVNAYNDRSTRCTDNLCMQAITVTEVADAVERALERRARADHQLG